MRKLFSSLKIREVEIKNRIAVSPMCQYSAVEGFPTQWHTVHLGTRAVGGAGIVFQEATSVSPEGRISLGDLGIWNDEQTYVYKKITNFISSQKCVPAIQLAHAGRKASASLGWDSAGSIKIEDGGWKTFAPSAVAFSDDYSEPLEMNIDDIKKVVDDFRQAAMRSILAGYKIIELHFAHGYLVHEFLSPLSNFRKDIYGGSFENRCRLAVDITKIVRDVIPQGTPLFARISSTDWAEGGWSIEDSVTLSKMLKESGVDLIDCSSGGNVHNAKIPVAPGYQVSFASQIKREADILTGAVGLITQPEQAEEIISNNHADIVLLAREMLRNPYWPQQAGKKLNADIDYPKQYLRGKL
jgi:2,4-dienoyl-CoA reductase-like NADH-dependent reductase (Old Yellow Enzyme family)